MAQNYCRLVDNVVAEIISIPDDADIAERFTPEIIETLVPRDESAQINMVWDGAAFLDAASARAASTAGAHARRPNRRPPQKERDRAVRPHLLATSVKSSRGWPL